MFDETNNGGIFDGADGIGDTHDQNTNEDGSVEEATTTAGAQPIPPTAFVNQNQNVNPNQNVTTVTAQGPSWLAPFLGAGFGALGVVSLLWPAIVGAAGSALAAPRGQRKDRLVGGALVGLAASVAANMVDAQHRIPHLPTVAAFGGGYTYGFKQSREEWPTPAAIKAAHTGEAPTLPAPRGAA